MTRLTLWMSIFLCSAEFYEIRTHDHSTCWKTYCVRLWDLERRPGCCLCHISSVIDTNPGIWVKLCTLFSQWPWRRTALKAPLDTVNPEWNLFCWVRENMKRIGGERGVFGLQPPNEPRKTLLNFVLVQKRSSWGRQSKLLGWHTGQNSGPPSPPWDPGSDPWLQASLRKAGSPHVHQPAFTKTSASSARGPGSPENRGHPVLLLANINNSLCPSYTLSLSFKFPLWSLIPGGLLCSVYHKEGGDC